MNHFLTKLCFATLLISNSVFADPVVVGISGHETETNRYAESRGLKTVKTVSGLYDNGNSFVRFEEDIVSRDFVFLLPSELNADQLMEALIKIRTARTHGAKTILVVSQTPLEKIKLSQLPLTGRQLNQMLAVAGATDLLTNTKSSRKLFPRLIKHTRLSPSENAFLAIGNDPSLAKGLSIAMDVGILDNPFSKTKGDQSRSIYYLSTRKEPVNLEFFKMLSDLDRFYAQKDRAHLITPYLPYARSDKVDQPGISITGRLVADLIEHTGVTGITFFRPHAHQSQGFFNIASFKLNGNEVINAYLKSKGVEQLVAPDEGAQKDVSSQGKDLQLDVNVINKARDVRTGQISLKGISGPPVKGKVVAIIDDETASGGTLAEAAKLLKGLGAEKVYAVVTHLAGGANRALESPDIEELIVTDTIIPPRAHPKLVVLSVAQTLARHLRHIESSRKDPLTLCKRSIRRLSNASDPSL